MNAEEKYNRQIEDYLSRAQDESARRTFEQNLQEDQELSAAFTEYQKIQGVVEAQLEIDLRNQLDAWETEEKNTSNSKKKGGKSIYLWILAGLLLVSAIIAILFLNKKEEEIILPQALAREYYQAPNLENTMGAQEEAWLNAQNAYRAGNMQEAIQRLNSIDTRNEEMNYYLAHAYYQTGDFSASIPIFSDLANGNSIFNSRAEWYLVLAHLNNEDAAAANTQLQEILADERHPFYERAQDLKNPIERIE